MNITLTGTKIMQDNKFLAFEKNNNVDVINITVDTDESWTYKLDVKYPYKCCSGEQLYNIINIIRTGNTCTAVLTKDMLPFTGKYIMQLRGISGDKVYHSDTFDCWVKYSIEPASTYDPVPSEFYQIEDNITEINNNPPKPGENGYWLIWDAVTHQYKESAISLPDGTLPEITVDTSGKYLSNDGKKAYWAEVQAGTEGKIDKIEVNNVEQPIIDKTVNIAVPTKTSDLSNDSGYITNEALNGYATKAELPTKVSQLENDSKFINESALDGYAKTADIPTKTSQLDNDSHYITASEAPIQSVNTKTGAVVLTQDDVGDGKTYVRTHNDFTDALKTQINTNEDNIAMAESDIDGLQTTVGILQTNVTNIQTALTSKQDIVVGGASTITEDNLTASRALVSDSSGKVAVSTVTSTELGYLDGVTSNVQTQLDKKLESAPVTSVNGKTGAVTLSASDVGAVATSDVTQTLGLSTIKIPSEKAVSDAMIHQLPITITYDSAIKTYSVDKTFAEIKTAYNNGYLIYCIFENRHYSFRNFTNNNVTFVGDNANSDYWTTLAIQIDSANKVTGFSTNLFMPNGSPSINGEYAPSVGAVSAVCWYLRPASDDSTKYYLWEHRENGDRVFVTTIWIPVLQDPNSYNLNIYYNGKVYEKAFFNSFVASDAPLTGKFIRMDYENGGIVCRVLSIDAHNSFMGGGTNPVIFSEQTLKVTTTET